MLENAIKKYQNNLLTAAQVIEELIKLAKDIRESDKRGQEFNLNDDELAAIGASDDVIKSEHKRLTVKELAELHQKNLANLAKALLGLKDDKNILLTLAPPNYHRDFRRKMGGGAVA